VEERGVGDKDIILFALKIREGAKIKKTDSMQYIFYVFDWQKYIKLLYCNI
jgi:hypothetical protein